MPSASVDAMPAPSPAANAARRASPIGEFPPMARDRTIAGSLSMARLAFGSTVARSPS